MRCVARVKPKRLRYLLLETQAFGREVKPRFGFYLLSAYYLGGAVWSYLMLTAYDIASVSTSYLMLRISVSTGDVKST